MDSYRIYGLDETGRIRYGEYVDAQSDAEAVDAATQLLSWHPGAEVWFGKRKVATPQDVALRMKT